MILKGYTYLKLFFAFAISAAFLPDLNAQPVPGRDENIPFLVTFGKQGKTSWGDADFYSIWFFAVPKEYKSQFYIRVFDPDTGGENDEIQGEFNTKCLFSIYGGKEADPVTHEDSRGVLKGLNYKLGNLLDSKVFGNEPKYDNKWYTFGPFNPTSGGLNSKWGYIFKVVCEGISGDDGNLYRYFLSSSPTSNIEVEGGRVFTYKYTFRLWNDFRSVSHIYPYIDTGVIFVRQKNFDWDNDGHILVVSKYKQGVDVDISNDDNWVESKIPIEPQEEKSSLDFQFHKKQGELVKNNNVVIITENQYGEALPFYPSPIGGIPKYEGAIGAQKVPKPKK
jgi:hypothetical protein